MTNILIIGVHATTTNAQTRYFYMNNSFLVGISLSVKPVTVQTSGKHVPIAEKVIVDFTCIPLIDLLSSYL